MEGENLMPSDSDDSIPDLDQATCNGDCHVSRKLDFESGLVMNGFVEAENTEVGGSDEESEEASKPNEKADSIHSRIRPELIPVVGMEFETEDDALSYYNQYAYKFGFGTRLSKAHTFPSGLLKDRMFVCSAEGKRGEDKRNLYVRSHRAETRFGCNARMKIKYDLSSQRYKVVEFVADHTHVTSSPSKTHLYRSHRKISHAQIVQANMAEDSGLDPKETLELLSRQAGGREHLGFIKDDYRNYLRSKRTREMKSGDTCGVLEYLQGMQLNDPSFIYAIQVDEDDLITNIFWADAKMKVDYDYFGDVVCFDTTYRKNKEGRPFAMFVGVNNHKQTLIFGAALLYDETAETFMWLFDTFAKTMQGKTPKSILTDQDAAMAKALASKWPETHHRLCIWHIYQNAAKHLKSVFEEFNDFAKDFNSIIYDYEDVEDFLIAWRKMLEKYQLQENTWLGRLFDIKEKWALVYGRETFCADITTTQRSESMNNAIKRYVNYKYDLLRFFRHFQRLVDDRRYNELVADFKAIHTTPALAFPVKILRNAAKVYTPAVFQWFQVELCKAHDCTLKLFSDIGMMRIYEVTAHGKSFHHIVTYDSADSTISCSCKKFEFAGILCSHALKVLSTNNVKTIPSKYISKRWRKDIRDEMPKVSSPNANDDDPKAKVARRYRDLARLHSELVTIAAESDEAYEIATVALHKVVADVKTCLKKKTNQEGPQVTSRISSSSPEAISDEFDDHNVRGIKVKEKIVRKEESLRRLNALEKLLGNKRKKKENSSSRHQREPEGDRSNVNSSECLTTPQVQVPVHSTPQMELQTIPSVLVDSPGVPSLSTMDNTHTRMVQYMPLNYGNQFQEVPSINNETHLPYVLPPPQLQHTLPALPPQMQFRLPFQHVQNLGSSNVGICHPQGSIPSTPSYQQGSIVICDRGFVANYQQGSIYKPNSRDTISVEEGLDLVDTNYKSRDESSSR